MSDGRDPPLFAGRSQQGSTPESAFRRPPPTEQQPAPSRSRHTTEPIRTGTSSRPPTHTGRVTFKSTTSSSAPKSIPAHSQEVGLIYNIAFFFLRSMTKS